MIDFEATIAEIVAWSIAFTATKRWPSGTPVPSSLERTAYKSIPIRCKYFRVTS